MIGHVFEPSAYDAGNYTNLTIDGNTATNVTYTNTQREFIFVDFRAPASGGNVIIKNNLWNMPSPNGGGATAQAIEMRFRQANASTVNTLDNNNGVGTKNGVTGATYNTIVDHLDIDAEDAAIVNATVTNNTFTDLETASGEAVSVATEDSATAGGPSTACYNVYGNTLSAAGNTIELNEAAGTMNIVQASAAAMGTANGGAIATVTGSPTFGQPACTLPPP